MAGRTVCEKKEIIFSSFLFFSLEIFEYTLILFILSIIPIWVRDDENRTKYVASQLPSVDSPHELDKQIGNYVVTKRFREGIVDGPECHTSLSDLAEYIVASSEPPFTVYTPLQLQNGVIVGKDYIDRKLTEQEMTELQKEILARLQGQ